MGFLQRLGRKLARNWARGLDRLVAFRPRPQRRWLWQLFLGVTLLLAFGVRAVLGQFLSLDLFLLPVLLSALVFRTPGLSIVPLAGLAYYFSGRLSLEVDNRYLWLNTSGQLLEWILLSGLTLVFLERYGTIRRLQQRTEQDLELARRLQAALMPQSFELGSVRLRGQVKQTLEVGGDFYYFRPFGQKFVVFCLGDVMGKGIPASFLMALIMGFMFEWGKKSPSPAFVLRKLNQRLTQWNPQQSTFVTLFYGVYDEQSQWLHYANAGHPPALLLRQSGEVEELPGTGLPLGILPESEWEERSVAMAAGERLLAYSDGLYEAKDPQGQEFSLERLAQLVQATRHLPLEDQLEQIEAGVRQHCRGHLNDDLALLAMERL